MNKLNWFRQIALGLIIPLTLSAQAVTDYSVPEAAAPAEVVKALRERVTQFFGYHIGPVNRKAIDLVAEDSKDYYFGSGKVQFVSVSIVGIDFAKDFQRASVRLETTQTWQVQQYTTVATTPVVTSFKIEDGKWVWFLDNQALMLATTPMGASAFAPSEKIEAAPAKLLNPDGSLNLPKDFAAPERVAAQGMAILKQGGLDKDGVTLTLGKAGQDQVVFHNGYGGQVSLILYETPKVPGLTITLNKSDLQANEDGVVSFVYVPPADAAPAALLGRQYTLRLSLVPFNIEFPIKLTLISAQ